MTLKLVRLSDIPATDPGMDVAEKSYRRGCHQTASRIATEIRGMRSLSVAARFIEHLADMLGDFRYDREDHPVLLDEAIRKVSQP